MEEAPRVGHRALRRPLSTLTKLERRQVRTRRVVRLRRWGMIALIAVGSLALFAVLPWLVWRGPYVLDAKYLDRKALADGSAALVTGLRTAIVAFVAALGASIALLYTARNYRLTRRGQITERFTKALERLGSPDIYVRVGGILALEQIVQDAPEQTATDAARVLGHFIRHRAPQAAPPSRPPLGLDARSLPDRPEADVQAALTALTRTALRIHVDPGETVDLSDLHLAGANLRRADLTQARLAGATLMEADLSGAVLTQANLRRATLTEANLLEAMLNRAYLDDANLTKAFLANATLTDATLRRATLTRACLRVAMLARTNLSEASLEHVDLFMATIKETEVTGAHFGKYKLPVVKSGWRDLLAQHAAPDHCHRFTVVEDVGEDESA